jgi:hypothetical protein
MKTETTAVPEPNMGRMSKEQWDERLREIRQEMVDEKRALPQGYLAALPFAINAARERGYALAQHGTMGRDLDLIAVPWTDHACSAEELALAIAAATGTNITQDGKHDPTSKPHGRLCWSLHFHVVSKDQWAIATGCYIDLAVMPRVLTPNVQG